MQNGYNWRYGKKNMQRGLILIDPFVESLINRYSVAIKINKENAR